MKPDLNTVRTYAQQIERAAMDAASDLAKGETDSVRELLGKIASTAAFAARDCENIDRNLRDLLGR